MLMEKGIQFENIVINMIKEKIKYKYISNNSQSETIDAMKEGIPVIFQGYFESATEKIKGKPDIIIRSDYIDKLIEFPPQIVNYPCIFSQNYHYRIIDIKYMTLKLSSEKDYILQTAQTRSYKMQLYVYNLLLADVQKYFSPEAYLLCRGWKTTIEKNNNCFNRLGTVNYLIRDNDIPELALNNLNHDLNHDSNHDSNNENPIENNIMDVYRCGVIQRDKALQNNITRWEDSRLTAKILGFEENTKISTTIENMLKVNRKEEFTILPNQIIMPNPTKMSFYVDIETVNDNVLDDFSKMPNAINGSLIYMIGVLCVINNHFGSQNSHFEYKTFIADNLTLTAERQMINKFMSYMYIKYNYFSNTLQIPNVYHWGHIEECEFKAAKIRHPTARWQIPKFINLCKVLQDNNVAIKGVFNYKLKDIGKILYNEGLIENTWTSETKNGKSSMLSIKKIASETDKLSKHNDILDLIEYNKSDVMVLYSIENYFRKIEKV
jgi:hypothetical protein